MTQRLLNEIFWHSHIIYIYIYIIIIKGPVWTQQEENYLNTVYFYHPVTRIFAESLLIELKICGSFFLRKVGEEPMKALAVSAMGTSSVYHYRINRLNDGRFQFDSQVCIYIYIYIKLLLNLTYCSLLFSYRI